MLKTNITQKDKNCFVKKTSGKRSIFSKYCSYDRKRISYQDDKFILINRGCWGRDRIQSVPITTKVVGSNPAHGEVYSIQHFVIKFFCDLWQVGGFLLVLLVLVSSTNNNTNITIWKDKQQQWIIQLKINNITKYYTTPNHTRTG